jgi:hypothetical protein
VGALVTVVALPMIYLRGSQPAVKALLLRNYGLNLTIILGLIAVITLSLYAMRSRIEGSSERISRCTTCGMGGVCGVVGVTSAYDTACRLHSRGEASA